MTEEKVFTYIDEHHMLSPGDRVVAGISGGADSVCLLFVLLEWAKRNSLSLAVVHVNHGIRKEAEKDAAYVENLCKEHEIPFFLTEADVRQKALSEKCSEEEAGRNVRYDAFARAAADFGAEKIAVAHNANDRSETMLFHLFRGSGLKGLCSIQPVRERIIRPLLCMERTEIEAYLQAIEVPFCTDATNAEDAYTRNRIRHHILPYVESEITAGCVTHMNQTADMLTETEEYLEQQTAAARQKCVVKEVLSQSGAVSTADSFTIAAAAFLKYHSVIQKRILFSLVKELSPHQKDIGYVHIQALMSLFDREGNRSLNLPFGIVARREYDHVFVFHETLGTNEISVSQGEQGNMTYTVFPRCQLQEFGENSKEVPENKYTKWFDYDKIEKSLEVRTRKTGDYLTITDRDGKMIHKSLKDYMITAKIPSRQRDKIPVLADGQHILWLAGYRISEYYKINENTKRILQVQLRRDCEGSEVEEDNGRTC